MKYFIFTLLLLVFSAQSAMAQKPAKTRDGKTKSNQTITNGAEPREPAKTKGNGKGNGKGKDTSPVKTQTLSGTKNDTEPVRVRDLIQNNATPVIEEVPDKGSINWTESYVEAQGVSFVNYAKFPNKAQAEELAKRGAVIEAKANLLELIQGVRVMRETTVKDLMTENDVIRTRVDGVVKGAKQVGAATIVDGACRVTVRMPLSGASGLAGTVSSAVSTKGGADVSGRRMSPQVQDLPDPTEISEEEAAELEDNVVLRFPEGSEVKPSMFPVMVDMEGNLIFDGSQYVDKYKNKAAKYLNLGKDLFEELNFKQGATVIDAIQNADGTIALDLDKIVPAKKGKAKKWLSVLGKVGKFLLDIVL